MNQKCIWLASVLATTIAAGGLVVMLQTLAVAQRDAVDVWEGVEVQTRGPVHEAFAGVVSFQPEAGVVVNKQPPEPIDELPAEQRPAGANVAWIPGYWAWDDDRSDFLWVSGLWRVLPPGRQWVPGYWTRADAGGGYQWITGYWADAQTDSVEYLPQPPDPLEEGPDGDPPAPDQIWAPGVWVWHNGDYAWRPGYWMPAQNRWLWVPACYVWTPRGYVFVDGYWDYSINRRGLLFAPVYLPGNIYGQPGFVFSPAYAINTAIFGSSLFLRPSYGHYYFGDYYGSNYGGAGFYPWFAFNRQYQNGYDPIFASQRWQNRNDPAWEQNLESQFEKRRNNESARPPRTLADQKKPAAGAGVVEAAMVAMPLAMLARSKSNEMKLETVNHQQRQELAKSAQQTHDFREQRQKLESGRARTEASSRKTEPAREKLPKSPVVAQAAGQVDKADSPPPKHEPPKPDPNAERRTTKAGDRGQTPAGEKSTSRGAARIQPDAASGPGAKKEDTPRESSGKPGDAKPKPAGPRPEGPPREEPKTKPEPPKGAPPKGPAPKPEAPKAEPPKSPPPKGPPPKSEPPKVAPPANPPKAEPPKAPPVVPKAEPPKVEPPPKPVKPEPKKP